MIVLVPLLVAAVTFGLAYLGSERRASADPKRRVAYFVGGRAVAPALDDDVKGHESPFARFERELRRAPGWQRFESLAERSGLELPAPRIAMRVLAGFVVVLLLGLVLGLSVLALFFVLAFAIAVVWLWLARRVERRRRAFEAQLPELLGELASAMRVGHGFSQALQAVAADAGEPAGREFARAIAEARLGRSIEDALLDLGKRVGSRDLDFVLEAVVVQRSVGGSLAGIFQIVSESVRQRQQHGVRLRALTAMGRLSALVLIAMPFVLAVLLTLVNRHYLAPLFHTSAGHLMLVVAVFGLVGGSVWLRRIVVFSGVRT